MLRHFHLNACVALSLFGVLPPQPAFAGMCLRDIEAELIDLTKQPPEALFKSMDENPMYCPLLTSFFGQSPTTFGSESIQSVRSARKKTRALAEKAYTPFLRSSDSVTRCIAHLGLALHGVKESLAGVLACPDSVNMHRPYVLAVLGEEGAINWAAERLDSDPVESLAVLTMMPSPHGLRALRERIQKFETLARKIEKRISAKKDQKKGN